MAKEKADDLKSLGNTCMKKEQFSEAILHYTHAIQEDSKNHLLYSNRSLAFLKMQQFYYAMEDAKEVIKLQPLWPKGYFRKGEVEYNVGNYTLAMMAYKNALALDPNDQGIRDAIERTKKEVNKVRKAEKLEPYKYGIAGLVVGFTVVLADQFLTKKPVVNNIIVQLLLVVIFTVLGLVIWKVYRTMCDSQKDSLLDPPIDLLEEMEGKKEENDVPVNEEEEDEEITEIYSRRRGGSAAGRRRYKMGKS